MMDDDDLVTDVSLHLNEGKDESIPGNFFMAMG